jgi:acetylornithine deacetylase
MPDAAAPPTRVSALPGSVPAAVEKLAARAADAVDEVALQERLLELLAVPSLTGDEAAAGDVVARHLHAAGLEVRAWDADPLALARDPDFPGRSGRGRHSPRRRAHRRRAASPRLLLVGHTDRMPPGEQATWSLDPFGPEVREGLGTVAAPVT